MSTVTLSGLHELVADDINTLMEQEVYSPEHGELHSSELLERVVWDVIVAFVVKAASTVFTDYLRDRKKDRTLSKEEINVIRVEGADRPFELVAVVPPDAVEAIAAQLPMFMRMEDKSRVAQKIAAITAAAIAKKQSESA